MNFTIIFTTLFMAVLFSGTKTAFLTSNKVRIELDAQNHSISRHILSFFFRHPEQFVTTLLIGNTINLIIASISIAQLIENHLESYALIKPLVITIQISVTILITLIVIDFSPKILFRIKPHAVLRSFSLLLYIIYIILYPLTYICRGLSEGLLRISGHRYNNEESNSIISKQDLDQFIQQSLEDTECNTPIEPEVKILQNALDFSQRTTRDCMIPRTEIIAIDAENITKEELITLFSESGYSKILVYRKNIDHIIGYIHSSDLFDPAKSRQKLIRSIVQVPGSMPAQKLMHILMREKKSIAVIIDEHGNTAGIASLEDLVEEIFGEIEDEHDNTRYSMQKIGNGYYEFSGRAEIEKINKLFALGIPESDKYKTIIGYILHYRQTLPTQGDCIEIGNYTYEIISQNSQKTELVRVHTHTQQEEKPKKSRQNT